MDSYVRYIRYWNVLNVNLLNEIDEMIKYGVTMALLSDVLNSHRVFKIDHLQEQITDYSNISNFQALKGRWSTSSNSILHCPMSTRTTLHQTSRTDS